MALTDSNIGHGKNLVFKVDNSGGTLTDISAAVSKVDFPITVDEAEAAVTGTYKHYKAGQTSGDITVTFTLSIDSGEAYNTISGIVGTEDLDYEYGPMGSTATYPKYSGKCICKGLSAPADVGGVVQCTAQFRPTGTITIGSWSA